MGGEIVMLKIIFCVLGVGVILGVMVLAFVFTNYILGEDDEKKRTGKRS